MKNKCYDCKYLVFEMYYKNRCNSPKNSTKIIDHKTLKMVKIQKQYADDICKETCGYKPTLKKRVKNFNRSCRLRYIKKFKPELLLTN